MLGVGRNSFFDIAQAQRIPEVHRKCMFTCVDGRLSSYQPNDEWLFIYGHDSDKSQSALAVSSSIY